MEEKSEMAAEGKEGSAEQEQVDKSEISSSLYKGSSEVGTTFVDSAYGSLGHSASSSLGPIVPPTSVFNHLYPQCHPGKKRTPSITPSSNSGSTAFTHSHSSHSSNLFCRTANKIEPQLPKQRISTSIRNKLRTISDKIEKGEGRKEKAKDDQQTPFLSSKETKAAKVATLSQALGYVDQYRKSQAARNEKSDKGDEILELVTNLTEVCQGSKVTSTNRDELNQSVPDNILEINQNMESDGFCVAVSLRNGMVIHTTETLTSVLGYPKDMWIGRSFIDFVHAKDREVFIAQVSENMCVPVTPNSTNLKGKSKNFFCRIRMYNGLKSGFAVKERKKKFRFFKLCICFSEINHLESTEEQSENASDLGIYLFITAIPLQSAYSTPAEEGPVKAKKSGQSVFVTKHSASCVFTSLDEMSVTFLGHFPHEVEGLEIFELIHPDDLSVIRESFQHLVQGRNSKSGPYRMKTRSGEFVTVVTVWSCFINPWSQQLEFIHGKHTVNKGPKNPNIFTEPLDCVGTEGTEKQEGKEVPVAGSDRNLIQIQEIKMILQQTVQRNQISKMISGKSTESKKRLSSFMGSLLQEVAKAENFELSRSALAGGTVVIGNISPHQSDSSESPPSYNQLTYNENLTRFFNSQPKTLSEKDITSGFVYSPSSYEENWQESSARPAVKEKERKDTKSQRKSKGSGGGSGEAGGGGLPDPGSGSGHGSGEQPSGSGTGQTAPGSCEKNSSSLQIGLSAGQAAPGGDDACMMSQDGCTSGSGSRLSGSREGGDEYKPPALTEELLVLHNRDMEKKMYSKFKEAKRIGDIGFLKDKKRAAQEIAARRLMVSKTRERKEAGDRRKQLSTLHEQRSKDTSQSRSGAKEYQRPLQLTDSCHFSSYSSASSPQVGPGPSRPSTLQYPLGPILQDGSQKFISVPAIMIPFSSTQLPQPFMMVQPSSTGYIPLGLMGDPVTTTGTHMLYKGGEGKAEPGQPGRKPPGPVRVPTSAAAQLDLPDCLAVDSCMAHTERLKAGGARESKPQQSGISGGGGDSVATSVKGEPGSALESETGSASLQGRKVAGPGQHSQQQFQVKEEELVSSSQSLYSFLQSSDEFEGQEFSSRQNSEPEDKEKSIRQVARPVLSEPFWNEGLTLSKAMMFTYELPESDLATILARDRERLKDMRQPDMVEEQLRELMKDLDTEDDEGKGILNLFAENEETEEEDTSDDMEECLDEKDKNQRRRKILKNLERLNIFLEENAPFPEHMTPVKSASVSFVKEKPFAQSKSPLDCGNTKKNSPPTTFQVAFDQVMSTSKTVGKPNAEFANFSTSRPQNRKFSYGKPKTPEKFDIKRVSKKADLKIESTESSGDDVLLTSSSPEPVHVCTPSDLALKRKKESSDSENSAVAVKQEDKKTKYKSHLSPEASSVSIKEEEVEETGEAGEGVGNRTQEEEQSNVV